MDGATWWATVHGAQRSRTRLTTSFFLCVLTSQFSKSHARSAGTRRRGALHYRGVSLLLTRGSHCSVFQRRLSPMLLSLSATNRQLRGPLQPETGLKAEQKLPYEGMHYSRFSSFPLQQSRRQVPFLQLTKDDKFTGEVSTLLH